MEKEIWKDAVGFEGLYQVSNKGRVKSLDKTVEYVDGRKYFYKSKILALISAVKDKYYQVNINTGSGRLKLYVHRLVATAFLPNPKNKKQVNHIDLNGKNNNLENLEWATPSENELHSYRNGKKSVNLLGEEHGMAKLTEKEALYILKSKQFSTKYFAKKYNVSENTIRNIKTRNSWKHLNP